MTDININDAKQFYCLCSTPFRPVALLWTVFDDRPKIFRVLLSKPEVSAKHQVPLLFPDSTLSSCSDMDGIAHDMEAFLHGDAIRFSLDWVCMDLCSEFQQKVLRAEHGIPRGSVSTYQRIARHLRKSRGARAVGNALAKNPFPIIIPCHRAICSNGSLGGYQGGFKMKRALLEMEGIHIDPTGCVATKNFFY